MNLEEMDRITKEATPGPWGSTYDGSSDWSIGPIEDPQGMQIASCHKFRAVMNHDAAFIAMARNKMEKLLAVAKAAKECLREERAYRGTFLDSEIELDKALKELENE